MSAQVTNLYPGTHNEISKEQASQRQMLEWALLEIEHLKQQLTEMRALLHQQPQDSTDSTKTTPGSKKKKSP